MPIIKSARKRVRTAEKATKRNAKNKRYLKDSLKTLTKKTTIDNLRQAQSAIDKAAKKHIIHPNKAARLKSRASKIAKEANLKPVKKATATKLRVVKTTKAPVKKPKTTVKKKS